MQIMNFKAWIKNLIWFINSAKMVENSNHIVLFTDCDGIVIDGNKKAHDILKFNNITLNEIINNGMQAVRESLKKKKSVIVQVIVNNKQINMELTASRLGKNYCILLQEYSVYLVENTNKKNMDIFNNEKNGMIVKIGDNIKSPISSIAGFSQGMLDGISGDLTPKQIKYLKIINSNALDVQYFVDKFLEFSYCESLLYKSEYKKFDIVLVLKDIIKVYKQKIGQKNISIDLDYTGLEDRNINIDINAFERAISNILDNCIFSMESGKISISLAFPREESSIFFGLDETKSYIEIVVKDNGSGIPSSELPNVCNPYAQLKRGRKDILRSLSLGIASILIKRCQGFINISSELTLGSVYNMIMPINKVKNE